MQGRFTKALKAQGMGLFGPLGRGASGVAFELKVCEGEKFLWSKLPEHQAVSLRKAGGVRGSTVSSVPRRLGTEPQKNRCSRKNRVLKEGSILGSTDGGGTALGEMVGGERPGGKLKLENGNSAPRILPPYIGSFGADGWAGGFGLVHKVSDSGLGFKPCDGFYVEGGLGVLVIGFNGGRDVVAVGVEAWWARYEARGERRGAGVSYGEAVGELYGVQLRLKA